MGPEDLYVERGTGRLWSVSEHSVDADPTNCSSKCRRVLYTHTLDWLQAQP
ncbi:hypothetical protein [Streptomyces sp. NPDC001970]